MYKSWAAEPTRTIENPLERQLRCWMTTTSSNSVFFFFFVVVLCVGGSGAKRLSLDSSPRWTSFHPSLLSLLGLLWPSRVYTVFVHLSVRSVPERDPPWAELRENERENRRKDTPTLLYVPAVVNQMGRSCDGSLR